MASSEQVVWAGQCLRCLMCNQQIEVVDGNMQLAVSSHIEKHEQSIEKREHEWDPCEAASSNKAPNSNSNGTVCKEIEQVKYNAVTSHLKLHTMKQNQESSDGPEEKLSDCGSNKSFTIENTQGVRSVYKRRSYKGKDNATINKSDNRQYLPISPTRESSILDGTHNACLKAHLGFIQKNQDGLMICKVCKVGIENTQSVSEHIETKSHEFHVLTYLKNLICKHRLFEFDFVIFCESSLYCNLCKCRIFLCSKNPHATIVNILNHNAMKSHVQNKSSIENNSSVISLMLRSLSQIDPTFVDKNKHHVAVEMNPQVICKLCNKQIAFYKDLNDLFKSFKAHFTSEVHTKCVQSSSVLKIYEGLNIPGKNNHSLSLKGHNIHCFICNCNIESDLEKLQEHVQATISKQSGEKPDDEVPFYKQFGEALAMYGTRTQKPAAVAKEELNAQSLLETMPGQFRNADYIVIKQPGKLSCLVCNCAMPLTRDHLKAHLLGGRHKMNEEAKKRTEKKILETPVASSALGNQASLMTHKSFNTIRNDVVISGHESLLVGFEDEKHYVSSLYSNFIKSSQDLNDSRTKLCANVTQEVHNNLFFKTDQSNYMMNIHKEIKQSMNSSEEGKEHDLSELDDQKKSSTTQVSPVHRHVHKALLSPMEPERDFAKVHQQGQSHDDSDQKHCSELEHSSADVLMDSNSSEERVSSDLMRTNEIIRSNYKYISMAERAEDGYYCSLCLITIHQSYDSNILLDKFLKHFTSQRHKDLVDVVQAEVLLQLSCSNPIIGAEKAVFKIQNKTIFCTLCALSMQTSFQKDYLERLLVAHLTGRNHKAMKNQEHMKSSEEPVSSALTSNTKFPSYYINSLPSSSIQYTGENFSFGYRTPAFLPDESPLPEIPFESHPPLLNQPKANEANLTQRLVSDSFKNLPGCLQKERRFIKKGWIDGFLSCSLCNCIVDPNFLRDHIFSAVHQERQCRLKKNHKQPCTNAF